MLKFNFYKKTILFLFIVCSFLSLKSFHEIDSYSELTEDLFKDCNEKTVVVFDVDDTLITSLDFIARDLEHSFLLYIYLAIKFPQLIFNGKKLEEVISIIVRDRRCSVFDKDIYKIIEKFKQKGCKLIALTDMRNSSLGVIDDLPKWRAEHLKSLGFEFSKEFSDTTFNNLKIYKESFPCLFSGILCTNKLPKGEVLGKFIDRFDLKPNKVIFFDDLSYQLTSVESECKKRKIPFSGVKPLGAKKVLIDRSFGTVADQIDNVLKTGIFLPDICVN